MYILGVPNFANYEATASLIRVPPGGGEIEYVSVAEERLSRAKHSYAFPLRGIHYCLRAFGLESLEQVDYVYTDYARLPRWLNSGPGYRKLEHDYLKLRLAYPRDRIRVLDHHDAHAASAFYPSPFDEAAVLVVDSLGSRLNTQTLYHFDRHGARVIERGDYWGIGRLYSLITGSVLPYAPEKGFGKTMGLAPYGREHPGPVLEFGSIDVGMTTDYSGFSTRAPLPVIVDRRVRRCDDRERVLDPYFARAAFDIQQECERQMLRMARYARERTGARHLCIAGGVGLNGLANARVLKEGPFEDVWIPPGCSDTGLSLGLALWGYFQEVATGRSPSVTVSMPTAYTGRPYAASDIDALLNRYGVESTPVTPEDVAPLIASGHVVAWFEGGSEFGPRALGHRSILADPRDPDAKDRLNQRVKFREGYRPYAPSILAEHASEWLELDRESPFMLLVVEVREDRRARVPAVTHVDGTTRPQTVNAVLQPQYHRMIREFHRLTGVPMVLNTSMNVNREPIVETPIDALICVFGTAIDYLFLDGRLIDCRRYAGPEIVQRLVTERAQVLDGEWQTITSRYLTKYDTSERDAYLAEENKIAEWHRSYRAKYEIERHVAAWTTARTRVLIVGTRGHTRCLYERIDRFPDLQVEAFVPLDERPGERGELDVYPCIALEDVDWSRIDAVLISTHEYQAQTAERVRRVAPDSKDVCLMYDDAGDSLLHVMRGPWPALTAVAGRAASASSATPAVSVDFEADAMPAGATQRYALIVSYHYCHPDEGFLKGTKSITPDVFDRQLRSLRQNFVCTTIGELMDPESSLPETVAVVTFDDGFKDVWEHAAPILQRWEVPATIYCSSAPLMERRVLDVHKVHLLQARLGMQVFRREFERELAQQPEWSLDPVDLHLENLYPYDDEATRRFKRLLNFELPYATLSAVLSRLFTQFIGDEGPAADQVYMSADDIRRCLDVGFEIGIHSHDHRAQSRLSSQSQRQEIQVATEYFMREFGVNELHFSYPYGAVGTWNAVTQQHLHELGFASAVTKVRAIVKPSDLRARWELPRYDVRDVFDEAGLIIGAPLHALFTAD